MVHINHPDRTGEILLRHRPRSLWSHPRNCTFTPSLSGCSSLKGTRAWVYLLLSNVAMVAGRPSDFEAGLVLLKLLLRLLLPPGAKERLGQQVMRRPVEMVWVHRDTFFESGDGFIPLFQLHPGPPKLKECRRFARIDLLRVFQGFRGFLRLRQAKVCRSFDKISSR